MNVIFYACMAKRKTINIKRVHSTNQTFDIKDLIPFIFDIALGLSLISCFQNKQLPHGMFQFATGRDIAFHNQ
jgi:hypothetical protein